MRVTQGTFSFLPDLTDEQITKQVAYCMRNGWAVNIEYTDDPHPRNTYWEMWGHPMFDLKDPAAVMYELGECRKVHRAERISGCRRSMRQRDGRACGCPSSPTVRPTESGFVLERQEADGRSIRYTTRAYATDKPAGARYCHGRTDSRHHRHRAAFEASGVGRSWNSWTRPGRPETGQAPHPRDRGAAAGGQTAPRDRPDRAAADAAHVLHRQSRHRQDHRRRADGRYPASSWATSGPTIWCR